MFAMKTFPTPLHPHLKPDLSTAHADPCIYADEVLAPLSTSINRVSLDKPEVFQSSFSTCLVWLQIPVPRLFVVVCCHVLCAEMLL